MNEVRARPLSPHLSIWRWGPHMLVSILHRVTGTGMATLGTAVFVWWLAALAAGPESYAGFHYWIVRADDARALGVFVNVLARIVAVGMTWAFLQHLANGVRHFVMDLGAGFELKANKAGSLATLTFSILGTAAIWAFIFATKGVW